MTCLKCCDCCVFVSCLFSFLSGTHYRFLISYFIFKGKDVTMSHRFFIACMQCFISRYASILPFKSIMPWTSMDPVCFGADFWLAHWQLIAVNPVRTSTPSCISLTCLSSAGIPTLKCAPFTLDQPPSRMKQQNTRQFMDLRLRLHSLPPTCIHSFLFAALAFASLRYAFDTVEGYQRILDSLGLRKIGGGIFQPDSEKVFFGNGNIP